MRDACGRAGMREGGDRARRCTRSETLNSTRMILASASPAGVALALAAAAAYAVPAAARAPARRGRRTQWRWWLAWLLHACALAWALLGDTPRFGFAPALSVTAWLVLTVYAVETPAVSAAAGAPGPGRPGRGGGAAGAGVSRHAAACSGSPWLPLHWALGIASYGLFARGGGACLADDARRKADPARPPSRSAGVPLLTLERLTFRFATAGFVLLSATLLAGLLFSEPLYGHGALALGPQDGVLGAGLGSPSRCCCSGGRASAGAAARAARVLYAGSLLLLLAYVGSRFVLEVVLGRVDDEIPAAARRRPGRVSGSGARPGATRAAQRPRRRAAHAAGRPPQDMVRCADLLGAPAALPTRARRRAACVYCSAAAPPARRATEPQPMRPLSPSLRAETCRAALDDARPTASRCLPRSGAAS